MNCSSCIHIFTAKIDTVQRSLQFSRGIYSERLICRLRIARTGQAALSNFVFLCTRWIDVLFELTAKQYARARSIIYLPANESYKPGSHTHIRYTA
jgi:hypothetical protein